MNGGTYRLVAEETAAAVGDRRRRRHVCGTGGSANEERRARRDSQVAHCRMRLRPKISLAAQHPLHGLELRTARTVRSWQRVISVKCCHHLSGQMYYRSTRLANKSGNCCRTCGGEDGKFKAVAQGSSLAPYNAIVAAGDGPSLPKGGRRGSYGTPGEGRGPAVGPAWRPSQHSAGACKSPPACARPAAACGASRGAAHRAVVLTARPHSPRFQELDPRRRQRQLRPSYRHRW